MEGLTSNQKGAIAESMFVAAAIRAGYQVYRPISEHERADLVVQDGERLFRVQCKWGALQGDIIKVWFRTSRHTPRLGYVNSTYDESEIDAIGVYCESTGDCYLLPVALISGKTCMHLRVGPAKNNQRAGLQWAEQYRLGAIAQLGERRAGSAKVAGSSPASSIPPRAT
jgi:PD-(D/E)XK endonuclease